MVDNSIALAGWLIQAGRSSSRLGAAAAANLTTSCAWVLFTGIEAGKYSSSRLGAAAAVNLTTSCAWVLSQVKKLVSIAAAGWELPQLLN